MPPPLQRCRCQVLYAACDYAICRRFCEPAAAAASALRFRLFRCLFFAVATMLAARWRHFRRRRAAASSIFCFIAAAAEPPPARRRFSRRRRHFELSFTADDISVTSLIDCFAEWRLIEGQLSSRLTHTSSSQANIELDDEIYITPTLNTPARPNTVITLFILRRLLIRRGRFPAEITSR